MPYARTAAYPVYRGPAFRFISPNLGRYSEESESSPNFGSPPLYRISGSCLQVAGLPFLATREEGDYLNFPVPTFFVMQFLDSLQRCLDLDFLESFPVFHKQGLGAMGLGGLIVGFTMGASMMTSTLLSLMYLLHMPLLPWNLLFSLWLWSNYIFLLSIFHGLEFLLTAMKQPQHLSYDSFIINHSSQYTLAFIICTFEYWFESIFLYQFKFQYIWISTIGLILMVAGQAVRTTAMW